MTRQTATPLHEYRTNVLSGIAWEITNSMRPFLILDPPYQRGSVWTDDQRVALINSWLRGLPIQAVTLNDRRRDYWRGETRVNEQHIAVVDGRQRIETAILWFDGELAAPASWFQPDLIESTEDTADGPYVTFDGLTESAQRMAKFQWKLPRLEVMLSTVTQEAELYLLVNGGGTPQTAADMANATEVAGR